MRRPGLVERFVQEVIGGVSQEVIEGFLLEVVKCIFLNGVLRSWDTLSRDAVESISIEDVERFSKKLPNPSPQ